MALSPHCSWLSVSFVLKAHIRGTCGHQDYGRKEFLWPRTDVYMHLDQFSVLRQNCLRVDSGELQSGGLALIKKNALFEALNQAGKTKFSL